MTNRTRITPFFHMIPDRVHDHSNSYQGGALAASAITSGILAIARGGLGVATPLVTNTGSYTCDADPFAYESVTGLSIALPAAGTYAYLWGGRYTIGGTSKIKFGVSVGNLTSMSNQGVCQASLASAATWGNSTTVDSTLAAASCPTAGTYAPFLLWGVIVIGAADTLVARVSNTVNANNAIIGASSFMLAGRIS